MHTLGHFYFALTVKGFLLLNILLLLERGIELRRLQNEHKLYLQTSYLFRCTMQEGTLFAVKTSLNVWRILLLSFLSIANLSLSSYSLWKLSETGLSKQPIQPADFSTNLLTAKKQTQWEGMDFCMDHVRETVSLRPCENEDGQLLWRSPESWRVKEAFFSDLNRDGTEELALLVWRTFQPWPVDRFLPHGGRIAEFHNLRGESCHLILIGMDGGKVREFWAGSAMADPIHDLNAVDLDGDGGQELAALEYAYDEDPTAAKLVIWKWNGFGFSLMTRRDGHFSTLLAVETGSGSALLTSNR